MSGKTIVILGGGVGGLVAANELRKRLSRVHRIVVVDREPAFVSSRPLSSGCTKPPCCWNPCAESAASGKPPRSGTRWTLGWEKK